MARRTEAIRLHRAQAVAVALIGAAAEAGCSRTPVRRAEVPLVDRAAEARACSAPAGPAIAQRGALPAANPPQGEIVRAIRVEGARSLPAASILALMETRPGTRFDAARADRDLLELFTLGIFEDVRIYAEQRDGTSLVVRLDERPVVGDVFFAGASAPPIAGEWAGPAVGDLYEPAAVDRARRGLERIWVASGYLDARVEVRAARATPDRVDVCFVLEKGEAWTLDSITFPGASRVPQRELAARIAAREGNANAPGKPYRPDLLELGKLLLTALLYDRGFITCRVGAARLTRLSGRRLALAIPVDEGNLYRVGRLNVAGRLAGPAKGYVDALGVRPGEIFSRARMAEGMERVRAHHRRLSGVEASVEPSTNLRPEAGLVDLRVSVGAV